MAELDRSTLFANEAFAIGMLQAVSGGALLATIGNWSALAELIGKTPRLLFLTTTAVTLALAVLAAYFRHQYKMWSVKADDSREKKEKNKIGQRNKKAACYLTTMRRFLATAVVAFVIGIAGLVVCAWYNEQSKLAPSNTTFNQIRTEGARVG